MVWAIVVRWYCLNIACMQCALMRSLGCWSKILCFSISIHYWIQLWEARGQALTRRREHELVLSESDIQLCFCTASTAVIIVLNQSPCWRWAHTQGCLLQDVYKLGQIASLSVKSIALLPLCDHLMMTEQDLAGTIVLKRSSMHWRSQVLCSTTLSSSASWRKRQTHWVIWW